MDKIMIVSFFESQCIYCWNDWCHV